MNTRLGALERPYSVMWTEKSALNSAFQISGSSFLRPVPRWLPATGAQAAYGGLLYTKWFASLKSPITSSVPGKKNKSINQNVFHFEALKPGNSYNRHNEYNERIKQMFILNIKIPFCFFPLVSSPKNASKVLYSSQTTFYSPKQEFQG